MRRIVLVLSTIVVAACSDPVSPPPVEEGAPAIEQLVAGDYHTCLRDESGTVACWGDPGHVGVALDRDTAGPLVVALPGPATGLVTTHTATCAQVATDRRCWGEVPFVLSSVEPVRDTLSLGGWQFTGGTSPYYWVEGHACLIGPDRKAYCWGANYAGQLGAGDSTWLDESPREVAGGHRWISLTAGLDITCGVTTEQEAFCWGAVPWMSDKAWVPEPVPTAPIATDLRWQSIRSSAGFVCGVATIESGDTDVLCWGSDDSGVVGRTYPGLSNPGRASEASIGARHACLIDYGILRCWGANEHGQLGLGDYASRSEPTAVDPSLHWKNVAVGLRHTCAVTTDDALYCWGSNDRGQVGDGGLLDRPRPVRIPLPDSLATL